MALERTAVDATARQPGLSGILMSLAGLLLLAFATLLTSSAHAGWADPDAAQQDAVQTVHAGVTGIDVTGVHRSHVGPGGMACPGAADACCSMGCGAFAHIAEAPGAPGPSASARLISLQSQAAHTVWRSAAFRPPIT